MNSPLPRRSFVGSRALVGSAVLVTVAALTLGGAAAASAAPAHVAAAKTAAVHNAPKAAPSAQKAAPAAKQTAAQKAAAKKVAHLVRLAAPTAVIATAGTSLDTVGVSWAVVSAARPQSVLGYALTLTSTGKRPSVQIVATRSSVRTATFHHLVVGTTYTVSVRALGLDGFGFAATTTYTPTAAPTVAPQRLFAIDGTGALVSFDSDGGTPSTLLADVTDYEVDAAGDAYALTPTGVVEVTAAGATRTVLAGDTGASQIEIDAAGNVFLLEGDVVSKVAAGTTTETTVTTEPSSPIAFGVEPDGTISLLEAVSGLHYRVVVSRSGDITRTQLGDSPYFSPISGEFDAKGNLYYRSIATGASGSVEIQRIDADQITPAGLGGGYVRGGLGVDGTYSLLQTATWCSSYGLGSGTCTPDYTVASISVTNLVGITKSVAVDGLSLSRADTAPFGQGTSVTSDSDGRMFVAGTAGITRYAATGGAPTTLVAGTYSHLQLNR